MRCSEHAARCHEDEPDCKWNAWRHLEDDPGVKLMAREESTDSMAHATVVSASPAASLGPMHRTSKSTTDALPATSD